VSHCVSARTAVSAASPDSQSSLRLPRRSIRPITFAGVADGFAPTEDFVNRLSAALTPGSKLFRLAFFRFPRWRPLSHELIDKRQIVVISVRLYKDRFLSTYLLIGATAAAEP
jgi:hypothetical protein